MNLLIHQGALGDWVLTFPILRVLPGQTLVAAAPSKARLAAALMPQLTPLDLEQRDWTLLHVPDGFEPIHPSFRQRLAAIDGFLVSFVSNGQDAWAANMRRLSPRATHLYVDPRPPQDWPGHVCAWHAHQLGQQGVALPQVQAPPSGNKDGPVVVHPGSGGRAKCWPAERFEALMDYWRPRGKPILPLLGEVELETWPPPQVERWRSRYQARSIHSLDELRQALAGGRLYVGNDSGPTHLAAQMGLPTLALFGPTLPRVWAPVGPQVRVLAPPRPSPMTWLGVEQVVQALEGRGPVGLL